MVDEPDRFGTELRIGSIYGATHTERPVVEWVARVQATLPRLAEREPIVSKNELYAQNLNGVTWHKSTHSEVDMSECVTVADLPNGAKAVRDSKNPDLAPLRFTAGEWAAFVAGVRDGEF